MNASYAVGVIGPGHFVEEMDWNKMAVRVTRKPLFAAAMASLLLRSW
jgi:hypothetical protein